MDNTFELFRNNPEGFLDFWADTQLALYPKSMVKGPPEVQQYCKSMLTAPGTEVLLEDVINAFDTGILPEHFVHIKQEAKVLQRLRTRLLVKS